MLARPVLIRNKGVVRGVICGPKLLDGKGGTPLTAGEGCGILWAIQYFKPLKRR